MDEAWIQRDIGTSFSGQQLANRAQSGQNTEQLDGKVTADIILVIDYLEKGETINSDR